jgi:Bifunctional DNA primase/polymerase, N-terminal/AAA domain
MSETPQDFAKACLPIFPLQRNGKIPLPGSNGWKDATIDPASVDAMFFGIEGANIGLYPEGAGMCVIDTDGTAGEANWRAYCAEHSIDPDAGYKVKTPHGWHRYYAGSLPPTASKIADHVDTRGIGSYVVAPGSVVDGKRYIPEADHLPTLLDLPTIPACIVEKCPIKTEPRKLAGDYEEDKPIAIAKACEYLQRHEKPVEFAGSDDACYRHIARLRDLGLSDQRILELMVEWTGFDEEWLEEKLIHVESFQQNSVGCDVPETADEKWATFARYMTEQGITEPDQIGPDMLDLQERRRQNWAFRTPEEDAHRPPLTYFDDQRGKGIFPRVPDEGCTIIAVGPRSSHKTGTVLKECLDAVFRKGAHVVYFAAEGAHGLKTRRLASACQQRGKTLADLADTWRTFDTAPGLMSDTEIDDFIAASREAGFAPDIIVLDTLTRAAGAVDISAPATGIGLILGMERLARDFGATVVAITHPGKDPTKGAIGSSLVESLTFAIWKINFDGSVVRLYVDKMKDGPAEFTVPLKVEWGDGGTPVVVAVPDGEAARLAVPASQQQRYKIALSQSDAYGFANGLSNERLAARLTRDEGLRQEWSYNPLMLNKTDAGVPGYDVWASEYHRQLDKVRNARKEPWGKALSDKRVPAENDPQDKGASDPVIRWFLPERTEAAIDEAVLREF